MAGSYTSSSLSLLNSKYTSSNTDLLIFIQDAVIYGLFVMFLFSFLHILLKYAKYKMDLPNYKLKKQEFYTKYGYSYEFAFVFAVLTAEEKEQLTPYQRKFTMKMIIDRLQNAGLETKLFYSCQRDEVYVKVRATHDRLLKEANRTEKELLLDPDKIRSKLSAGKILKREDDIRGKDDDDDADDSKANDDVENDGFIWKPVTIEDKYHVSKYLPYSFIYGNYIDKEELKNLYMTYKTPLGNRLILREVDRIKMLVSIMSADLSANPPGAGLSLTELKVHNVILAAFPIHNYDDLEELQKEWLGLTNWRQPLDKIKDYFGERIGLYFAFLQHYTHALYYPAILGLITFAAELLQRTIQSTLQPYFTVFMVLWNTVFIENWKRKQARLAMEWGVNNFEEEEVDRPQFHGIPIRSPINNSPYTYFPYKSQLFRKLVVYTVLSLVICVVIGCVASIFVIQEVVVGKSPDSLKGFDAGVFATAIAQSVLIRILDYLFQFIVLPLNDFENHRTQTVYEDNLIFKFFLFKMVNCYSALIYTAFFKQYFSGTNCEKNLCVYDLSEFIRVLFLVDLIFRIIYQVPVRLYLQWSKDKQESAGVEPGKKASAIEKQYILAEYDILLDTLNDYAGLLTQYGYMILFVAVFPVGPFLAMMCAYVQIRIDGWKLCQATRRPLPAVNEDIGMWQDMLEIVSIVAVLFNMALLMLITTYLIDHTWLSRWIVFIIAEHALFMVKFVLSVMIDDVPPEVEMQIERKDFIVGKILENKPDDIDPPYKTSDEFKPIYIADTDKGWIYPEVEEGIKVNEVQDEEKDQFADEAKNPELEMKNIYTNEPAIGTQ